MRNVVFALAVSLSCVPALASNAVEHLDSEMARVKSDTALVLPSQAIDEYALWSADGRYLAVNVEGEWQKIDLQTMILDAGTWHGGQVLGVIANQEAVSPATPEEISAWQKVNKLEPRQANVGGTQVELAQREFSTALVVTLPGRKPETRWQTEMENCHSLVVAPTKRHVAFICEMNGLFVLRVAPEK